MRSAPPSSRRDLRFRLRPDAVSAEFDDPRGNGVRLSGVVDAANAAGLALLVDAPPEVFSAGTALASLTVRIGRCVLRGEAVVRNQRAVGGGRIELGCLFYPDPVDEDRWMTLLAGMEAVGPPEAAST